MVVASNSCEPTAKRRNAKHFALPGRGAFSLLELMAVVTIMGILVAIVLPRVTHHTRFAKIKACNQFKADLESSIERYYFDHAVFPDNLSDLTPDYYPDDVPVCPIDGSSYTIDPVNGRISGHNHP